MKIDEIKCEMPYTQQSYDSVAKERQTSTVYGVHVNPQAFDQVAANLQLPVAGGEVQRPGALQDAVGLDLDSLHLLPEAATPLVQRHQELCNQRTSSIEPTVPKSSVQ